MFKIQDKIVSAIFINLFVSLIIFIRLWFIDHNIALYINLCMISKSAFLLIALWLEYDEQDRELDLMS